MRSPVSTEAARGNIALESRLCTEQCKQQH